MEAEAVVLLISVADSERRRLETSLERRLEGEQLVSEAAMIVRTRNWKMRFLRENILTIIVLRVRDFTNDTFSLSGMGFTFGLELIEI